MNASNRTLQLSTSRTGRVIAASVIIAAMTGCASTGHEQKSNEGMRKGAIAGAAIGLTMGALTGDAELAAKAAVAGGVAGGASGMMADYDNDRQDYRAETIAGGLAGNANTVSPATSDSWEDIDKLVGNWRVDVWGYDAEGQRVTAQATAEGKLSTTRSLTMTVQDFQSDRTDLDIRGNSTFSYEPNHGYELVNSYGSINEEQRFVGEYRQDQNRYSYYYAGSAPDARAGHDRSDVRLDMRFVGRDVIIIDTLARIDGQEVAIQSYRFTRIS